MSRRSRLVLVVLVSGFLFSVPARAQHQAEPQSEAQVEEKGDEPQPGATQGGVTTAETDAQPKFDMDYFVGEWTFESTMSDSPLGMGGPVSGRETVRNTWDGRFWDLAIAGEGPEGPFSGQGVMMFQDTFAGQSFARYEFTTPGVATLKTGLVGCDAGGSCNLLFETPPFEHQGSLLQLTGRYYLVSPFRYRVTTQISIDKGAYRNLGTVWYAKDLDAEVEAIAPAGSRTQQR